MTEQDRDNLPEGLQDLINQYDSEDDISYERAKQLCKEVEKFWYVADYDLSGEIVSLEKTNTIQTI